MRVVMNGVEIDKAVDELAVSVLSHYRGGEELLVMPVLHAAMRFGADLMRKLPEGRTRLCAAVARSYVENANSGIVSAEVLGPRSLVAGANVVVADVIYDTGATMRAVTRLLRDMGARSVVTCCLVRRFRPGNEQPDLSARLFHGDEFLVGYGLDDDGLHRGYPAICAKQG